MLAQAVRGDQPWLVLEYLGEFLHAAFALGRVQLRGLPGQRGEQRLRAPVPSEQRGAAPAPARA
jgi:hypothetical protein